MGPKGPTHHSAPGQGEGNPAKTAEHAQGVAPTQGGSPGEVASGAATPGEGGVGGFAGERSPSGLKDYSQGHDGLRPLDRLPPLWARQLGDLHQHIQRLEAEADGRPHVELERARLAYATSLVAYSGTLADLASLHPTQEQMKVAVVSMRDVLRDGMKVIEPWGTR